MYSKILLEIDDGPAASRLLDEAIGMCRCGWRQAACLARQESVAQLKRVRMPYILCGALNRPPSLQDASEPLNRRTGKERIRRKIYADGKEARRDIFDYIEMFHNPTRRHGYHNRLSPANFEFSYVPSAWKASWRTRMRATDESALAR